MTEGRKRGARDKHHRSRITNGKALLPSVHGQSVWGRIMKDVMDAVYEHCGGEGAISELERLQARRIAALEASRLSRGQDRCCPCGR
jgi:hypothetical protein